MYLYLYILNWITYLSNIVAWVREKKAPHSKKGQRDLQWLGNMSGEGGPLEIWSYECCFWYDFSFSFGEISVSIIKNNKVEIKKAVNGKSKKKIKTNSDKKKCWSEDWIEQRRS